MSEEMHENEKPFSEQLENHFHSIVVPAAAFAAAVAAAWGSTTAAFVVAAATSFFLFPMPDLRTVLVRPTAMESDAQKLGVGLASKIMDMSRESDAEYCWVNGYGRFKHSGLRDDPLASDEPPTLSSDPLSLPLPELSIIEAASLDKLSGKLQDLAGRGCRDLAPHALLRHLRAERGNVSKADSRVRKLFRLWQSYDIGRALTHWNLKAYERCLAPWWLSGGFIGHGLKGQPIAIERIGKSNWPKLMQTLSWADIEKLDIIHCLRCVAALEEDAMRRGSPFRQSVLVLDLDGFGSKDIQFRAAYMLTKLQETRGLLLAETISTILFVRTPAPFVKAWNLFKHLLDPGTLDKVKMANKDGSIALLRQYISDDVIPAYLGGSNCIGGDPECSKVLAPGGFPPPAALDRFRCLLDGEATCESRKPLPARGSRVEHDLHVDDGAHLSCGVCPRRADGRDAHGSRTCF